MINLLHEFLSASAEGYPDKRAIVFGNTELTYSQLEEKTQSLASYLKEINIRKGDRVAILLGNTIETAIAFWGTLKAGAVAIPMGAELKPEKIAYVLKDSGAKVLITRGEIIENARSIFQTDSLEKVLLTDDLVPSQSNLFESFSSVLESSGAYDKNKFQRVLSVDLSAIIYTSGSTGEPKGVMLTHQNMVAAANSLNAYLGYRKEDKILCALPLSFDYGLYQMIMSVSKGATLLLEREMAWPIFLVKRIIKEKATIFPAVPTMVMMLFEQSKKKQFDLSSIRAVTNTGAALTRSNISMLKSLFEQAEIFSMYGLTECKRCTYLPPKDIDAKPDSVGIAIPNTELWLVDGENNRIEEPHQMGQLVIRGATVMKGYWNKPEKTAEKLKDGPLPNEKVLYTGDYCTLDEDGYLYFKGRMDNMIKSRGIKVSPKEVEDFLHAIPGIKSSVVTGVRSEEYGEVLYAFVVLDKASNLGKEDILLHCKEELEVYKVPEYLHFIDEVPKTPNGKFNRLALKKLADSSLAEKILNT